MNGEEEWIVSYYLFERRGLSLYDEFVLDEAVLSEKAFILLFLFVLKSVVS